MIDSKFSIFESQLMVRPDDIDMFNHVHNSKYLDYVLAARYEQMERFYGMSWERFSEMGFGWVVSRVDIRFKRPLKMGDAMTIRTGILEINAKGCTVQFEIENTRSRKIAADGLFEYVMIDISTGKGAKVTADMIEKYSI